MKFDSLSEKCNYYRSLTDYKLIPNLPVIIMLDGRSFSKVIKKRFSLPFDKRFIDMMDFTAKKLCAEIEGCRLAYVQSDEISLFLEDYKTIKSNSFFGYRLTKVLSIAASIATGYFNRELWKIYPEADPIQFDCKAWNVPNLNDVYAWFLHRQNDCVRNSKQQVAQSHYSHKQLEGLSADNQVQKLKDEKGISWWHDFRDEERYGRIVLKEKEHFRNEELGVEYDRSVWKAYPGFELNKDKDRFMELICPTPEEE